MILCLCKYGTLLAKKTKKIAGPRNEKVDMDIQYCRLQYYQGTKLTFLARSRLAPKYSKLVAKVKKLGAIKKKIVEKTHYTVASNG